MRDVVTIASSSTEGMSSDELDERTQTPRRTRAANGQATSALTGRDGIRGGPSPVAVNGGAHRRRPA